jgi:oligopeptide/dipeptide ABC transporter ATP-binding protein
MAGNKLLEVKNLKTSFFTPYGEVKAVNDVSYYIDEQEIVAIVGESGCGKSVTQRSVIQLIQSPPGKILEGEVIFQGENLLEYAPKSRQMRSIRGSKISMIFQEPMTSLNPVFTIGQQLVEVICTHENVNKKQAWDMGTNALEAVGIPDPEKRMNNYPFEMSGGMRQRVLIAIAVACNSKLIIADEPTTALDVTTQAQVMELLLSLVKKYRTSLLIVTHNLGLVTRYAHRIYVMYAGRIIESGTAEDIITSPMHPYTVGLLKSVPKLDNQTEEELATIKGVPPPLAFLPQGCAFSPRCTFSQKKCKEDSGPVLRKTGKSNHFIACHFDIGSEVSNA